MSLHHGWGCHPNQTASHIHVRLIQNVWAFGMLSQGYMGAPLYHSTGLVGPRFGNSGSSEEWKWCHYVMVEADIHLRLLLTFNLDIFKGLCLSHWYAVYRNMGAPVYHSTCQVGSRLQTSCFGSRTYGVKMTSLHYVWGWYPTSDCFPHPYLAQTKC
jgi:hypothetical protein